MKSKHLKLLVLVLVVLAAISQVVRGKDSSSRRLDKRELLSGVASGQVAKIILEQGKEKTELELRDGRWVVPTRNGYPADETKVGSLLLKLFDLSSSQKLPTGAGSAKDLSLDSAAISESSSTAKISMLDSAGKNLATLFFGKRREDKSSGAQGKAPSASGQYVRRDGEEQIYLIGLPINLTLGESNWLDGVAVNIREANIVSIEQFKIDGGSRSSVFSLIRKTEAGAGKEVLTLSDGPKESEDLQESTLSQVRGGLENARLSDVKASGDPSLADIIFDIETEYRLDNGLKYTVYTSQKDDKIYARFRVALDEALVAELKSKYDQALKDYQEKKAVKSAATPVPTVPPSAIPEQSVASAISSSSSSSSVSVSDSAQSVESVEPKEPEPLKLANAGEVESLNKKYESWVYELASFQGKKYRYTRADLVKPKEKPAEVTAAASAPDDEVVIENIEDEPEDLEVEAQ